MSFETIGPATWVTALCALKWLFSSMNAKVAFRLSRWTECPPALLAMMCLLLRVPEDMVGKACLCDWREVAPFALVYGFSPVWVRIWFFRVPAWLIHSLHCTMCTLFSTMPLYLLWPCIRYNKKKGWIQGHILGEITDLEFGTHGFLMNHVFLPTEQVETNICWMIYQDATFKTCLSLFGWKENILPKMHIVQCHDPSFAICQ